MTSPEINVGDQITFKRKPTSRLYSGGKVVGFYENGVLVERRIVERTGQSRVETFPLPFSRIVSQP